MKSKEYETLKTRKRYDIVYIDPPWDYGTQSHAMHKTPYPTMTEEELIGMHRDIKRITKPRSLMYMWVPSSMIPTAIRIAEAWRFKYKTIGFVWDKQARQPGHHTVSQCEVCLIFRRGRKDPTGRGSVVERQFVSELRREHSRKPDSVRDSITKMWPTADKIEIFARTQTPGWDVWGNETDKFESPEPTQLF